ncbi:MAG: hypothetical protein E7170_04875 [Firmicutes bacterium]|nr:hypothetical protein [Bacillota bacterium]
MAQITINTSELYKNAQNINTLIKDTTEEFNLLFKKIEEVPYVSKEWIGLNSERFSDLAKEEKIKYYKFIEDLALYSKLLSDFSVSLDVCINNIRGRI